MFITGTLLLSRHDLGNILEDLLKNRRFLEVHSLLTRRKQCRSIPPKLEGSGGDRDNCALTAYWAGPRLPPAVERDHRHADCCRLREPSKIPLVRAQPHTGAVAIVGPARAFWPNQTIATTTAHQPKTRTFGTAFYGAPTLKDVRSHRPACPSSPRKMQQFVTSVIDDSKAGSRISCLH